MAIDNTDDEGPSRTKVIGACKSAMAQQHRRTNREPRFQPRAARALRGPLG
jgi:hypothetical protein